MSMSPDSSRLAASGASPSPFAMSACRENSTELSSLAPAPRRPFELAEGPFFEVDFIVQGSLSVSAKRSRGDAAG
jgi:hypothetical protein